VLVTRAREEVHLVTSIPQSEYRALPPVPPGQQAAGTWLVFAYLAYAEALASLYAKAHTAEEGQQQQAALEKEAQLNIAPTKTPSPFAEALAKKFAQHHRTGSDVYWGNEGFGIDLALHHPQRAADGDVTVGILCDGSRFTGTDDPVEWDIFRTGIHESQGWQLHRIWTPSFFRDPAGQTKTILARADKMVATEQPKDSLRVTK
jgi:hypothetical protein